MQLAPRRRDVRIVQPELVLYIDPAERRGGEGDGREGRLRRFGGSADEDRAKRFAGQHRVPTGDVGRRAGGIQRGNGEQVVARSRRRPCAGGLRGVGLQLAPCLGTGLVINPELVLHIGAAHRGRGKGDGGIHQLRQSGRGGDGDGRQRGDAVDGIREQGIHRRPGGVLCGDGEQIIPGRRRRPYAGRLGRIALQLAPGRGGCRIVQPELILDIDPAERRGGEGDRRVGRLRRAGGSSDETVLSGLPSNTVYQHMLLADAPVRSCAVTERRYWPAAPVDHTQADCVE